MENIIREQKKLCQKYHTTWTPTLPGLLVSVSSNIHNAKILPINGLRHPAENDSTGWYFWRGEDFPTDDVNFFLPIHAEHLEKSCPDVLKFLGLPPGWRFLTDGDITDIWEDKELLNI